MKCLIFTKKIYKGYDVLYLVFSSSPVYTLLRVILLVIFAIVPTAINALVIARFVDTATEILHGTRHHGDIYLPFILLLVTLAIITIINPVAELITSRMRFDLQSKLKPAILEIHSMLDFKHIENIESWELISRVSRDPVGSVMAGFQGFMGILEISLSITSVMVLIITQVWWAALVIIAFSVPMIWLSLRAGTKNYQAERDAEKFNRRNEYLGEILTGRDNVDERTLFGYGDEVNKRWREQYEAGRILKLKVNIKMAIVTKGSSMILALVSLLIALTLIRPVVAGDLSAGMYIGIESSVFGLVRILGWQLYNGIENISYINEYMKDFTAFLSLSKSADYLNIPDAEPIDFKTLEFKNVGFKYPSSEGYVLDKLSFSLVEGRHYAFVGKNGEGKTTITKLLTGLYNDYEGEILINGKELRQYPVSTVKAMFSIVYQDFAKYYISLEDNILLGDINGANVTDRIPGIATIAGLEETIFQLKKGMDTPLGKILEDGQDISGGQWQRVAIARSLISGAPIKILDEPTANLDPISESQIYSEFEKLMKGKTTIFISHRLGSTKLADEILVINGGKIVEHGTHNELMASYGQYAEMFETQRRWYQ